MVSNKQLGFAALSILAVAACKTPAEHMVEVIDKLTARCYEVEGLKWKSHVDGGIALTLPSGEVKVVTGNELEIEGLKKKDKLTHVVPPLRPVFAVAIDPAYSGSAKFGLGAMRLSSNGSAIPVASDATALNQLKAQAGNLNWSLQAASTAIDPPFGTAVSLSMGVDLEFQFKLSTGSVSAPKIPVIYALRLADTEQFEIIKDVAEHEHDSFKGVQTMLASQNVTNGRLTVARGQALTLSNVSAWNNSSDFTGNALFSIERETGSSGTLLTLPFTLPKYNSVTVPSIVVPTGSLLQGEHELVIKMVDGSGQVSGTTRVPLDVTGPQYQLPFRGLTEAVSVAGGSSEMWIDGQPADAGAAFAIVLSLTQGMGAVVNGTDYAINPDATTSAALSWLGGPLLPNGIGALDANGFTSANFVLPPSPALLGLSAYFSAYLNKAGTEGAASSATEIKFVQ